MSHLLVCAKRRSDLRGNLLSSEFFANAFTVFCSACLREDDERDADPALARRGRLIWTLRAVRTCPVHGLELLRRKKVKWDDAFHQMALRVPERAAALDELVEAATPQSPSPLQNYVIERLDGATGPIWLDSQTLEQAVRATEMLGVLLKFGPGAETGSFSERQWDVAGRSGYAVTSRGEGAIRDALQAVQADFVRKGGKPERGNVLGPLYG
ncbi:MAG: TniQ family protein [Henriciella sp.]|uniref:TniQ family protein n=1 Tax=Henriciella sp. TaxID=1968823 RepID=UPI003C723215